MNKDLLIGGVSLIALSASIAYLAQYQSFGILDQNPPGTLESPTYSRPAQTHNALPYTKNGMRVYDETRGDITVLLLDLPDERGIVVATTPHTNETIRNGTFGGVNFSASGRYLTYGLTFWEWGSFSIYDTQSRMVVLTLPMGDGAFDTSEKYFYSCYYAGIDGSHDATVYRATDFAPVVELYTQYPDLAPSNDGTNPGYTEINCGEDESNQLIVFEFGEYAGMQDEETIVSVKRRFIFDLRTEEIREASL